MTLPGALYSAVSLALLGMVLQERWITLLQGWRAEQVMKDYGPHAHRESKMGIPSVGGAVFLLLGLGGWGWGLCQIPGASEEHLVVWGLALGASLVGFLDDFLKISRKSSEGLSSRQKFLWQMAVCLPWAFHVVALRGWGGSVASEALLVMGVTLGANGMLNAVNVTDGLDGLAAGSCALSFVALAGMVPTGSPAWWGALMGGGIATGFLWHNAHPARVFMGDGGAHFLGGLLLGVAAFGRSPMAVVAVSPLFGVEILSVAIQIVALRCFHRRVFRMSPLHHHFELGGWKETQIVTRFMVLHAMGIVVLGSLGGCFN
ncbi:MAG TPA: phospho-N-acetylmuramoyl-pentapeptide-transferase [Synergistaceae bacterium]|nr:phospho-N-acetylmuramoyl-pentapeptide-transferase [Synergistaceae bacterium]